MEHHISYNVFECRWHHRKGVTTQNATEVNSQQNFCFNELECTFKLNWTVAIIMSVNCFEVQALVLINDLITFGIANVRQQTGQS
jgi:hypothetical protein